MFKTTLVAAFMLIITISFSQSVEEIFEKSNKARGGVEKIDAIKTWTANGKFVNPNMGQEIPFKFYWEAPDRMKLEYEAMGNKIISLYDGEKGWMQNPFAGMAELTEVPKEQLAEVNGIYQLLSQKLVLEEGENAELLGTEEVDGKVMNKVQVSSAEAGSTVIYFDAITNLIEKTITKMDATGDGAENELETIFIGRTKTAGVIVPESIETKIDGNTVSTIQFESIVANEKVDPTVFKAN